MVQTRSQAKNQNEVATKVITVETPTKNEVDLLVKFKFSNTAENEDEKTKNYNKYHNAISRRDFTEVENLIKNIGDVNAKNNNGETPLFHAVRCEDLNIVKLLVKNGADVNARNIYNWTPLTKACCCPRSYSTDIVEYLVKNGADMNIKDDKGQKPIHHAKMWRSGINIVEYLTKMNPLDIEGRTKLHLELIKPVININEIKKCLKKGIDVNERDDYGKTALYYACKRDCELSIIKLLVEHGANEEIEDNDGLSVINILRKRQEKLQDIIAYFE